MCQLLVPLPVQGALGPHWKSQDEHLQMVTGRSLRVREEYFSVALTK